MFQALRNPSQETVLSWPPLVENIYNLLKQGTLALGRTYGHGVSAEKEFTTVSFIA